MLSPCHYPSSFHHHFSLTLFPSPSLSLLSPSLSLPYSLSPPHLLPSPHHPSPIKHCPNFTSPQKQHRNTKQVSQQQSRLRNTRKFTQEKVRRRDMHQQEPREHASIGGVSSQKRVANQQGRSAKGNKILEKKAHWIYRFPKRSERN
ncbi:hypothetical protein E2C01_071228 [Portunus trituberculatus]|uniref:Uncharacterized protein n=1 Tax=Portunus trituberculatus TaxID=210409 RepID=A0A5B7I487_PORTR|nr:hypothetical protein [Portunus trituberculatus]